MSTDYELKDFRIGANVQAHPGTDTWMRGDRYGVVEKVGQRFIHVRMTVSGRVVRFTPGNLLPA